MGRLRSQMASPHGQEGRNKAAGRPICNEAQYGGTRDVSLEHAEEKSAVDRPDLICSSHIFTQKRFSRIACDAHKLYAPEVNVKCFTVI